MSLSHSRKARMRGFRWERHRANCAAIMTRMKSAHRRHSGRDRLEPARERSIYRPFPAMRAWFGREVHSMNETERDRILRMVQEGTLRPHEAAHLLAALADEPAAEDKS